MRLLPTLILLLILLLPIMVLAQENTQLKLPIGLQKLIQYETEQAQAITFLAAFLAGLVALTSPCAFVLIPVFLSYSLRSKKKALFATAAFSIGLLITFIIFGIIASVVGSFFNQYKNYFAALSGIVIIIFGIMILYNKGFSIFTPKIENNKNSFISYMLFGIFFAGAWTPCIGPVLGSIFFLAANTGSTIKSITLLLTYAIGIIVPLLLISIFSDKINITRYFKVRPIKIFGINTNLYNLISAIILFILGILILIYSGTYPLETFIQRITPWSMGLLVLANDVIINSDLVGFIGVILALLVLVLIIYYLTKSIKNNS